ncbi:MAG: 3-oxoacyl-(acyl-carrier-protein) reductase FabG [candidate division BRC1 bacterium ADurb.BinA364]|nr:MAG: 3-oxoacyl-(acyl-carrier-protein) reductase FabG [candidate division BRC1 bacterium ADurb.BinA364]
MSQHTTLITGASVGIGRATAERLARSGHQVIGMARRETKDFPGRYVQVDLADRQATQAALDSIAAEYDIDGLVNNVGLVNPAPLEGITIEQLMEVYDLNVRCAVQCAQAVVGAMKARGYGRIVNIASLVVSGVPHRTSYAAAKSALVSCTQSWALELARFGITVNAVSPGPTSTELFNRNNPPGSDGYKRYTGMVPMKRVAPPEEIAAAVCFFLSEEASFVTGQNLYVDGGASVGPPPE